MKRFYNQTREEEQEECDELAAAFANALEDATLPVFITDYDQEEDVYEVAWESGGKKHYAWMTQEGLRECFGEGRLQLC